MIQPTSDRRNMEVYLPQQGLHIYVPRKLVLPIKHLPPEIHSWDAFSATALASRAAFQPSIQHHPFLPADVSKSKSSKLEIALKVGLYFP